MMIDRTLVYRKKEQNKALNIWGSVILSVIWKTATLSEVTSWLAI